MSELKFRIWDKTNKRMIKNEDILRIYMRFREIEYIFFGKYHEKSWQKQREGNAMKIRRAIDIIKERIEINKEIMEEHDFGASIREEIEALEAAIQVMEEKLEEAEE